VSVLPYLYACLELTFDALVVNRDMYILFHVSEIRR